MKILDKLDRYLIDDDYRINIYKDRVYIINYIEIKDFSSTRVIVRYKDGYIVLTGTNLVVSKMLDDELLITGKLEMLEYK